MPFDRTTHIGGGTLGISDYDTPEPGFMETVGAAFRTENIVGSGYVSRAMAIPDEDFFKKADGYDVYEHIKGYEPFAERFEQVYNPIAEQAVKADIDREKKDNEILAASGWVNWALGLGAAGLADPTILMPGGIGVKAGRIGYSAGKTALNIGIHSAASAAVQEAALFSTQQTRTVKDALIGIGGSVILGGVIGSCGARLVPLNEIGSHTSGEAMPRVTVGGG